MKIAFIGTHGVGKTTLCFDLAARMKRLDLSVDIVKEVARHCPLPINRDTTLDAQRWILHQQISEEIGACARFDAVICDRSVLDNYAYLVHRMGNREELEPLVQDWARSYDALFKVPVVQAPRFDGTRDVSAEFQREIDDVIEHLLVRFGVRCHRLDPAHRASWPATVLRSVGLPESPNQFDLFDEGG
ncbi:MAG TPA: ATP-binding protein [Candidatus Krumholzibacteria bacterium]|nr:ATP-binding protein [Candidatus Krumholzibacteria bacterium]